LFTGGLTILLLALLSYATVYGSSSGEDVEFIIFEAAKSKQYYCQLSERFFSSLFH